jgi:hypothetical protein
MEQRRLVGETIFPQFFGLCLFIRYTGIEVPVLFHYIQRKPALEGQQFEPFMNDGL